MRAPADIHPLACRCDRCRADAPTGMTPGEFYALMALAGLMLGFALCELAALLAGAPHVTVIFGGNG